LIFNFKLVESVRCRNILECPRNFCSSRRIVEGFIMSRRKRPAVTPYDVGDNFKIVYAHTLEEALRYRARGYLPIECSFGGVSVVDDVFVMDHHGSLSHMESVAIRAYRDHFGARRSDPRFVVTGHCDEDATFAICALTGCIPHPSLADLYPNAPLGILRTARQNMLHVAKLIAEADVNPDSALSLVDSFFGRLVLNWRLESHATARDILAWYGGVNRWRSLLTSQCDSFIEVSREVQENRIQQMLGARQQKCGDNIVVADFSEFGPNVAYYKAWLNWNLDTDVLVAFIGGVNGVGNCSFACRDLATATKLFGEGGFLSVYDRLDPLGSGGREIIGGSPRGGLYDWKDAVSFGHQFRVLSEDLSRVKVKS